MDKTEGLHCTAYGNVGIARSDPHFFHSQITMKFSSTLPQANQKHATQCESHASIGHVVTGWPALSTHIGPLYCLQPPNGICVCYYLPYIFSLIKSDKSLPPQPSKYHHSFTVPISRAHVTISLEDTTHGLKTLHSFV